MNGRNPPINPMMMQQMSRRMPPGMGGPGIGGAPPPLPGKETFNPLPDGKGAIQVLKSHSGCQMPREAATLNALLQKSQEVQVAPGNEEALYAAMAESITLIFRSDHECEKNISNRTAGLFDEDPELKNLSDKVDTLFKACTEMEKKLRETAEEFNRASQERWEKSIKAFGLNIQERFYRIDIEKRAIQQVDLKCEDCQGIKMLRSARQKLAGILIDIDAKARGENVTIETPVIE